MKQNANNLFIFPYSMYITGLAGMILFLFWPFVHFVYSWAGEIISNQTPWGGWTFSERYCQLFGRTLLLAGTASCLTTILGFLVTLIFSTTFTTRSGSSRSSIFYRASILSWIMFALMCLILYCPPMVFSVGWREVFSKIDKQTGCIMAWMLWGWPFSAMILFSGWCQRVTPVLSALMIESNSVFERLRVYFSLLRVYLFSSFLVTFLFFLSEYSVPHAMRVNVVSTELLSWAHQTALLTDVTWRSLPAFFFSGILVFALMKLFKRVEFNWNIFDTYSSSASKVVHYLSLVFFLIIFILSWILPIGSFRDELLQEEIFGSLFKTYGISILITALCSIAAAAISIIIALICSTNRILWLSGFFLALFFSVIPGALLRNIFISSFIYPVFSFIYDTPVIVTACLTARFLILFFIAVYVIQKTSSGKTEDAAGLDGSNRILSTFIIQWPQYKMTFYLTALLSIALSMGEVASIVRPPGLQVVSLVIIEKMHRLEDGMLIGLTLSIPIVVLSIIVILLSVDLVLKKFRRTLARRAD